MRNLFIKGMQRKRAFAMLLGALVILQGLDLLSTLLGLHLGVAESNPLILKLGAFIGLTAAVFVVKALCIGAFIAAYYGFINNGRESVSVGIVAYSCLSVFYLLIFINNLGSILNHDLS